MPASKGAFGKSGQIAISADLDLSFELRTTKHPEPAGGGTAPEDTKTTSITFGPALDYFVADSISIGGKLLFGIVNQKQGDAKVDSTIIGIGPRVGYNLGLADNISLWPKLSFTYAMVSSKSPATPPATGDNEFKGNKITVGVDVPVLFHPAEHFFVGLGPFFELDLSSKGKFNDGDSQDGDKDTAFGLRTTVGGWF